MRAAWPAAGLPKGVEYGPQCGGAIHIGGFDDNFRERQVIAVYFSGVRLPDISREYSEALHAQQGKSHYKWRLDTNFSQHVEVTSEAIYDLLGEESRTGVSSANIFAKRSSRKRLMRSAWESVARKALRISPTSSWHLPAEWRLKNREVPL